MVGSQVNFKVDESVPTHVITDAELIFMIMVNFLSNAFKHVRDGTVTATVDAIDDKGTLRFAVADTGLGVPADFVPHLFKPFARATAWSSGTGLGLYHSQQLAISLRGNAGYMANHPRGAIFYVDVVCPVATTNLESSLPILSNYSADTLPQQSETLTPELAKLLSLAPCFVVDDDPIIRDLTTWILTDLGAASVSEAVDGQDAEQQLLSNDAHADALPHRHGLHAPHPRVGGRAARARREAAAHPRPHRKRRRPELRRRVLRRRHGRRSLQAAEQGPAAPVFTHARPRRLRSRRGRPRRLPAELHA
eukprot:5945734-Pleurochrysis_carterae.AAC.2